MSERLRFRSLRIHDIIYPSLARIISSRASRPNVNGTFIASEIFGCSSIRHLYTARDVTSRLQEKFQEQIYSHCYSLYWLSFMFPDFSNQEMIFQTSFFSSAWLSAIRMHAFCQLRYFLSAGHLSSMLHATSPYPLNAVLLEYTKY
jgi:hypothetical protein